MKQLITILLCLFTLFAEAQVNTNDTNKYFKSYDYGFSYKRLQAREAFIMPTDTVINKLGAVSLNGAIYLGNGVKWTSIGGGTTIDTTSLSNRINQRIDSLIRRSDSVFARKNGVFVFQYKDSIGTTPTLQQVTTAGATSTNAITIPLLSFYTNGDYLNATKDNDGSFILSNAGNTEMFKVNDGVNGFLKFGGGTGQYVEIATSPGGNVSLQVPQTSGTIPLSVNGNTADVNGNITIPAIDTTNKFVNRLERTSGKDSIIYFVGANRFAIKDSVGTNPAPVGYYGAFQDTTTQTAALINTAYAVRLGVTDLSNAVTIANNTRIKIANAGIYNIQFSLQLEKTGGSGNMISDIWLRKNGVNLAGTTGKVVLTGSANASPVVAAWNYVIAVASGDSLELMWATSNDNVVIKASPATAPHPSIPSAILTVTQQSGIMAGTGISPLDTANMLSKYVNLTTAQTIGGTKTFSSNIKIPSTGSQLILQVNSDGTVNGMTTSIYPSPVELAYVKGTTSAIQTQLNNKVNISDTSAMLSKYLRKIDTASLSDRIEKEVSNLDILQALGYGVKAEPYGLTLVNATAQLQLTSGRTYFYPFSWNVSDSIRGVSWFNRAASTTNQNNYNGCGIYSLSGGTLTRIVATTNDSTFWDCTSNNWSSKTIPTTYLAKGTYFFAYQISSVSGVGVLPTILGGAIAPVGEVAGNSPQSPPSVINPNGVKYCTYLINAATTLPSSVAMSATVGTNAIPYFMFY